MPFGQGLDKRIAYIDLFAGPGRYKNGAKSTPLMILEKAAQDQELHDCLVTYFNDKDAESSSTLKKEIQKIPGIEKLKYEPDVYAEEIVKMFEKLNLVPTLFFVDPWGYKGLSLRLINSVLKFLSVSLSSLRLLYCYPPISSRLAKIFRWDRRPAGPTELCFRSSSVLSV